MYAQSIEEGRGLRFLKATNKVIGGAPLLFSQGAFWERGTQDGRPDGLFTEHSVQSGVKEVRVRYGGGGVWRRAPQAKSFDFFYQDATPGPLTMCHPDPKVCSFSFQTTASLRLD